MNKDKTVKELSQDWWYKLGAVKAQEMRDKYFPEYALLTVSQRQHIYESEHPQTPIKEDTGSIEDAANKYVEKIKRETDYKDKDIHLEYGFKNGGEWVRGNELKPLEELCRELKDALESCHKLLNNDKYFAETFTHIKANSAIEKANNLLLTKNNQI